MPEVGSLTAHIGLEIKDLKRDAGEVDRAFKKIEVAAGRLDTMSRALENFGRAGKDFATTLAPLKGVSDSFNVLGRSVKQLQKLVDLGPGIEKFGVHVGALAGHLERLRGSQGILAGLNQEAQALNRAIGAAERGGTRGGRAREPMGVPLGPVPLEPKWQKSQQADLDRTVMFQARLLRLKGQTVQALQLEMRVAVTSAQRQGASLERLAALQRFYLEKIRQAEEGHQRLTHSIETGSQALSRMTGMVQRMVGAFLIYKTGQFFTDIVRTSATLEGLPIAFKAITGSADQAGKEMAFIRSEADQLGQEFLTMAESWKNFAGQAQGALGLENARKVFISVAEAATVLRMSQEDTAGTFKALEQMASKGVISMEELRGQLSEHGLVGAIELFAAGLGKSTTEMNKLVKQGKVLPVDLLKFADQVSKKFHQEVPEAVKGSQAALNKFSNAILDAKVAVGQGGFLDAAIKGIRNLTTELGKPETIEGLKALGKIAGLTTTVIFSVAQGTLAILGWLARMPETAGQAFASGEFGIDLKDAFTPPRAPLSGRQRRLMSEGGIYKDVSGYQSTADQFVRDITTLPPVDDKAARAAQMSLERTLELQAELLQLQGHEMGALEMKRKAALREAERRKADISEIRIINALYDEQGRILRRNQETLAHQQIEAVFASAAEGIKKLKDAQIRIPELLAEQSSDYGKLIELTNQRINLASTELGRADQLGLTLEKQAQLQETINQLLERRNDLHQKLYEIANPATRPITETLEAERQAASDFQDIMLDQSRFNFERGRIGRGEMSQALEESLSRAEERWVRDPTAANLSTMIALQRESSDLSVNLWDDAFRAISNSLMNLPQDFEDFGSWVTDFFRDLSRNVVRNWNEDMARGIVNAMKGIPGEAGQRSGAGGMGFMGTILNFFRGAGESAPTTPGSPLPPAMGQGPSFPGAVAVGGGLLSRLGGFLGNASAGAGIGSILASVTGGSGMGSMIGGGIGGALGAWGGSALGTALGGTLTGILGSAAPMMLGAIGGPIGMAVGSIGGSLLGSLFGGKKSKDPIRAAIKQWVEQEWRPAWRDLESMGFTRGIFEGVNSSEGIKRLGWGKGIPQEALKQMKAAGDALQGTISEALSKGLSRFSLESGWAGFQRTFKRGIYESILDGMIEAVTKGSAMTMLAAPLYQYLGQTAADVLAFSSTKGAKGKAFDPLAFQAGLSPLVTALLSGMEALKPFFEGLFQVKDFFKSTLTGGGGGLLSGIPAGFIPSGAVGGLVTSDGIMQVHAFERIVPLTEQGGGQNGPTVNAPITQYNTINNDVDVAALGNKTAFALVRRVKRQNVGNLWGT